MNLRGRRLLITGPTSQVALPIVRALASDNEVFCLARFRKPEAREAIESLGARCFAADLGADPLDGLPRDFDAVLHFAVAKSGDFDDDLRSNAEAVGRLMSHCRDARAFLHCSSAGVYEDAGAEPLAEDAPLGDNHRAMLPTYSVCKIAAEAVVRFSAREYALPTTIARLSVPYGDNGGWPWFHLMMMKSGVPIPVHAERPCLYNPIHEDDYVAQVPRMLEIASVPATIVNWGGPQVALEQWCAILGDLTSLEPHFETSGRTIGSVTLDLTRMHALVGEAKTDLRDGLRRMVLARSPELLRR